MQQRAPVFGNVLEMIGNTPMLELKHLDTGPCRLFVKMESLNPGNSIKDRIAVSMIEAAEKDGRLKPGGHIVEATAGNTGLALALVAAQKGYTLSVVVPDKMSDEKISHLRAMGAEVVMTRSDVAKGHPEYYQDVAARLAASRPGAFYINQFSNDANAAAHLNSTGPEIWEQLDGKVDAVVVGVGSGGTLSGVGHYLRNKNPNIQMILADPVGSILTPLVNEGKHVEPGSWLVEGIGEDFVPSICDLKLVTKAFAVSDGDAFHTARELLRKEGILAGSSVGTLLCAALHHVNDGPLLRAAARQRDALEGVVDVLGDRRALRDGRAVVELKHRHRGARILGGEIGRAVLSLHHVNVDELHFRGSPFFRKSDAHARGVRKAFEVVNPHRLFSLW